MIRFQEAPKDEDAEVFWTAAPIVDFSHPALHSVPSFDKLVSPVKFLTREEFELLYGDVRAASSIGKEMT